MRLRSLAGFEVVFAVLAFVAAALTYSPSPGYTAEWRSSAPDLTVGTVTRGDLSSIQAHEERSDAAALVGVDPLRLDLIGQRGHNYLPCPHPRGAAPVGDHACERSIASVAAVRARITELSYSEVATTLARARVGAAAAHSTGPPSTPLI